MTDESREAEIRYWQINTNELLDTVNDLRARLVAVEKERDDARKGWYDADLQCDAARAEVKALREALTRVMDELMDKGEVSAEAQDNALVALAALAAKEKS